MKPLLKTLTETFAPSGYEDAIRKIVQKEVKPFADEIRVDAMGSLIVHKKPTTKSKKIRQRQPTPLPAPWPTAARICVVGRALTIRWSAGRLKAIR